VATWTGRGDYYVSGRVSIRYILRSLLPAVCCALSVVFVARAAVVAVVRQLTVTAI